MSYSRETNGLTVTTFLPVTSYTPSSGCYGYYRSDVGLGLMAFDPAYGYSVDASVTCEPAAVTTWWLSLTPANSETIVSLGPLTCPDQWETVALSEADASSTMKMCCPSGFYHQGAIEGEITGRCVSNITSGQTYTYASQQSGTYTTLTTTMQSNSHVGALAISSWEIIDDSVAISSTTGTTTSGPASVSATTTSGGTLTSTTSESTHTGSSSSGGSQSLSTGATAGIAVGAAVGVVGFAALIAGIYLMRRSSKRKNANQDPKARPFPNSPFAASSHSSGQHASVPNSRGPEGGSELPVQWHLELEGTKDKREHAAELP